MKPTTPTESTTPKKSTTPTESTTPKKSTTPTNTSKSNSEAELAKKKQAEAAAANTAHQNATFSQEDALILSRDTSYSFTKFPAIEKSGNYIQQLERDKLLINGYGAELNLIDRVEAGEVKSTPNYYKARKRVNEFLNSSQRDKSLNLKGNRQYALKSLSDPSNERMYSSLSLLYYYCEGRD
jgi:hypothetical protein